MKTGETIKCNRCGGFHIVEESNLDKTGNVLLFVNCGKKSFIVGMNGKKIKEPETCKFEKTEDKKCMYAYRNLNNKEHCAVFKCSVDTLNKCSLDFTTTELIQIDIEKERKQ